MAQESGRLELLMNGLRSKKAGFAWVVLHVILPLIFFLLIVFLLFSKTGLFAGIKEKVRLMFNKYTPEFTVYKGVVFKDVKQQKIMEGFVQFLNVLRSYQAYSKSKKFENQEPCIAGYYFPKGFVNILKGTDFSLQIGKTSEGIGVILYKGVSPALKDPVSIQTSASLCLIPGTELFDCIISPGSNYCPFTNIEDITTLWIGKPSFKEAIKQSGVQTKILNIENKEGILPIIFMPGKICFITEYNDYFSNGCNKNSNKPEYFDTDCHKFLRAKLSSCDEAVRCDLPKDKDDCRHYLRDQCEQCGKDKNCRLTTEGSGFLGFGKKLLVCK